MLTKDQEKMITMLIEGERITDIAKKIGVSRQTIYSWMNKDDAKAELDQRRQTIANQANNYILKDVFSYIDGVKELAKDNGDKRTRFNACKYLIDRVLGIPTAIGDEDIDNSNDNVNENELEEQLKRFKNIKVVK